MSVGVSLLHCHTCRIFRKNNFQCTMCDDDDDKSVVINCVQPWTTYAIDVLQSRSPEATFCCYQVVSEDLVTTESILKQQKKVQWNVSQCWAETMQVPYWCRKCIHHVLLSMYSCNEILAAPMCEELRKPHLGLQSSTAVRHLHRQILLWSLYCETGSLMFGMLCF